MLYRQVTHNANSFLGQWYYQVWATEGRYRDRRNPTPAPSRAAGHRPHPRLSGRQDRSEPADEPDPGGNGPARARQEGREPYLLPELWDLFPDRLVDSELGEIPEGWGVKTLNQPIDLNPREPMQKGTAAPYLEMAALPTTGSSPDDTVLRGFKSGARFRNGDTLLVRITPCLENGKAAFVQLLPKDAVGWGSTEFIVMRAITPIPVEYPYLLSREEGFREHAIQSMTGTAGRQRVQVDALASYLLPSPSGRLGSIRLSIGLHLR